MTEENAFEKRNIDNFDNEYNLYYPLLFSAVYAKVNNYDDACDICQEVFMLMYKKYDEIEEPRKWIFGTMRFVVMDYYRKKKKRKDEIDVEHLFDDISLSFVNGFRDARLILEEAFGNDENFKDERERTVFELIAFHNFTYEETAKHLDITTRQASYKYRTILQRIMQYLKSKGINNLEELL